MVYRRPRISRRPRVYRYPRVYRSPFVYRRPLVYRRPQRRVRVFGCCLPIPLGGLLLTGGGLALAVRRARAGLRLPGEQVGRGGGAARPG